MQKSYIGLHVLHSHNLLSHALKIFLSLLGCSGTYEYLNYKAECVRVYEPLNLHPRRRICLRCSTALALLNGASKRRSQKHFRELNLVVSIDSGLNFICMHIWLL